MELREWINTDLAEDIWNKKYKFENETFNEWLDRVSGGNKKIKQLIVEKKFLFGGRILANRGLQNKGKKITYSNCYVIEPPEDNIESIFQCASKLARTFSYGGGCGIDISKLAPLGARVNNAAKETSGSVSFMDLYSLTTELIGQNGRRGALMISLDCTHPDIEEFINIKNNLDKVTKANISVKITDEFMTAVENDSNWELSYKREETGQIISKTVKAKKLFRMLAKNNWNMAEPGILNWSAIENWNLLSEDNNFKFAGVNPCAEEPLPAGGSCLLGSINLAEFVKDKCFDFNGLKECVKQSVIALNEVLDEGLSLHPLSEQRDSVKEWRQIGLGIMGLADMLIKMEFEYGKQSSLDFCSKIAFMIIDKAIETSALLAKDKYYFPMCEKQTILSSPFFIANTTDETKELVKKYGLHNSQLLTCAPTGSISTMLGISGGLEPIYANSYTRKTESLHNGEVLYKIYTPIVQEYMDKNNIDNENDLPNYFVTAMTLDYNDRLKMQSVWQKHIDASISSTVNVGNDFTIEQVEDLYFQAWKLGLKGVTIFRDGCARMGILTTSTPETNDETQNNNTISRGIILDTSDDLIGKKRKLTSGCGSLHVLAYFDPATGDLFETYLNKGSTGGCNSFMVGLSRMLSLSARAGVGIHTIVEQLNSSGTCPSYSVRRATKGDISKGSCCPSAIANALLEMQQEVWEELGIEKSIETVKPATIEKKENLKNKSICPECSEELRFEGGCNSCISCGYSKCS